MLRTLFFVPKEVFGLPLFGVGLLLAVVALCGGVYLFFRIRREGVTQDVAVSGVVLAAIAAAIVWVIPFIIGDEPGLPVRGYGAMLLLAVVAGLGLILLRARQMGVAPEIVFNLSFAVFIAGILGARLLFVLQYWDNFQRDTWKETLLATLNMTQGGLVVYGAFIGAALVFLWYVRKHKLPALALADIFVASLVLGQGIGRLGCFMNGCCYGGVCESPQLPHVTFPWESPPHIRQAETGRLALHGLKLQEELVGDEKQVVIAGVEGPAEGHNVSVGERLISIANSTEKKGIEVKDLEHALKLLYRIDGDESNHLVVVVTQGAEGAPHTSQWSVRRPLARSLPTHPAQLYDAINGLLLFLFAWVYFPFRRRDGEVFAMMLTVFPVTRFLMEWVRTDEAQNFLLGMTISQTISAALFACSIALWLFLLRQGKPAQGEPIGRQEWAEINRRFAAQREAAD